jgi:phage gp36-like protein
MSSFDARQNLARIHELRKLIAQNNQQQAQAQKDLKDGLKEIQQYLDKQLTT